ncbi:MAG: hypothetical protein ABUL55_00340 [Pseudomonadota bacterium]
MNMRRDSAHALIGWALSALWVMATVLLCLVGRSRKPNRPLLRKWVCVLEHRLTMTLMMMAALRAKPSRRLRCAGRARPSFALRMSRTSGMRRFTHGLGHCVRGDLRTRLLHVLAVLREPERFVRKLIKRLTRGLVRARIILVAPPALLLSERAPALTPAAADSS